MIWQEKKGIFRGWETELKPEQEEVLKEIVRETGGDILKMTAAAKSGHPGGSLSSGRILAVLYGFANINPENCREPGRDRIIVSIGHVAPAVYATLAQFGFFPREDPIIGLRRIESLFAGHIESKVPGVEWNTGCLGQGLAAAVGKAYYAKKSGLGFKTFVLLGDGDQQKEQVGGARSLAMTLHKREELGKLISLVDYNNMQLSGPVWENTRESLEDLVAQWGGSGWQTELAENSFRSLYGSIQRILGNYKKPAVVFVKTRMGEGVSLMEKPGGDPRKAWIYHGKPLSEGECRKALAELKVGDNLEEYLSARKEPLTGESYEVRLNNQRPRIGLGEEKASYQAGERVACREAFGEEIKRLQKIKENECGIVNIDPDIWPSTMMPPDVRTGVREIAAAGFAGSLSQEELVIFFSTFGVFATGEIYNTLRMAGLNQGTKLCVVGTHCGLDVGEDGPTHQCIDYLGLARNLTSFKVLYPADGNQAREMAKHIANGESNYFIFMGRNKMPVISDGEGKPFFGNNFELGKAYWLKEGEEGTIITYGNMVGKSLEAREKLKEGGLNYGVLCFSSLSPTGLLDREAIQKAAERKRMVVYEDHLVYTGLGNMIANELMTGDYPQVKLKQLGIKRKGGSGSPEELYKKERLDVGGAVEEIIKLSS